jgi:hypothetical protein
MVPRACSCRRRIGSLPCSGTALDGLRCAPDHHALPTSFMAHLVPVCPYFMISTPSPPLFMVPRACSCRRRIGSFPCSGTALDGLRCAPDHHASPTSFMAHHDWLSKLPNLLLVQWHLLRFPLLFLIVHSFRFVGSLLGFFSARYDTHLPYPPLLRVVWALYCCMCLRHDLVSIMVWAPNVEVLWSFPSGFFGRTFLPAFQILTSASQAVQMRLLQCFVRSASLLLCLATEIVSQRFLLFQLSLPVSSVVTSAYPDNADEALPRILDSLCYSFCAILYLAPLVRS